MYKDCGPENYPFFMQMSHVDIVRSQVYSLIESAFEKGPNSFLDIFFGETHNLRLLTLFINKQLPACLWSGVELYQFWSCQVFFRNYPVILFKFHGNPLKIIASKLIKMVYTAIADTMEWDSLCENHMYSSWCFLLSSWIPQY